MKFTNITNKNSNLNIYFSEINKKDVLTKEDEISLFKRIQDGDMSAQNEIFEKTAKFAVAVAKTYTDDPETLEDLIQEANLGIIQAIPRFEIEKGYNFISFAVFYMKKNCSAFLGELNVVSQKNQKLVNKVNLIKKDFYKKYHRDASDFEIVEILEKNGTFVKNVCEIQEINTSSINISVSSDDDSETTREQIGEFATSTAGINDYEYLIQKDFTENMVNALMSKLSPIEKTCVSMYYGIGVDFPKNYQAIGEELSKTDERVRQIINVAIKKMSNKN